MKALFDGVKEFNKNEFEKYREHFENLSSNQNPHTLFIGCSDSRVVPDLITKSMPGDLFVVRNVANIVPYYRKSDEQLATTSAIEYAVLVLKVENIVICGHSNCGGCRALFLKEEELAKIPYTQKWIELAKTAKIKAEHLAETMGNSDNIEWMVEQINIVEQMNHLLTYPFIQDLYQKGSLNIYGWYYEIKTGTIYNYNAKEKLFEKIQ
jgi:carbonic anhydrase